MGSSNSSVVNKVASKEGRYQDRERGNKNSRGNQKTHSTPSIAKTIVCEQCTLKGHLKANCRTCCRYCKLKGHIVANCRKAKEKKRNSQHHVEQSSTESVNSERDYGYSAESNRSMYQVTQNEGMLHDKNVKHFSDNLIENS